MRNCRGFIAENKSKAINKVLSLICSNVYADEVVESDVNKEQPQINYEQLISQARKEEKEKLYPRINKLEDDNRALVKTGNDNLIKIGDLMQKIKLLEDENVALKSTQEDSEVVTSLKSKITELETEINTLKETSPNEETIRKEIEAEYEVKMYATEQQTLHKDSILSSFIPNITGKTKEEIDLAVTSAKEKSLAIKKELGIVDDDGNPIVKDKETKAKKEKPKTTPKANPVSASSGETSFDADYIRSLDPASEEYKEFRKSLGLK